MKKVTVRAHSNIAFVKYWGRKDEVLRLPTNGSISMNLSNLYTTTTIEFDSSLTEDIVVIDGSGVKGEKERVSRHLDRIRSITQTKTHARIETTNSFPAGTGLSSSASGFAALTVAGLKALNISLSEKETTILARQGSGSACRSIPDGFVEWMDGNTSDSSFAHSLYAPSHWNLIDIVAVVSSVKKDIPTSVGQTFAQSSPFYEERNRHMADKIKECKALLAERDFNKLGIFSEREALEMHAVMITSWPSLIYWLPNTIVVMKHIQKWRSEGLPVYFTINTGQDIHVLCEESTADKVESMLKQIGGVSRTIRNTPSKGTYELSDHLF